MDIQIDTREKQRAIRKILKTFDDNGVKHFSSKLLVGDYMSLDNPRLIIDRKQNLQELCGNVCQQHERFKRELLKAINAGIQLVILVEHGPDIQSLEDVWFWENPRKHEVRWRMVNGKREKYGSFKKTQYYKGLDEIAQVYENTSTETDELESQSTKKLQDLCSKKTFGMDIAKLGIDVGIGDIVGGRDYLTGMYSSKPIENIIYSITNRIESKEYELEGENDNGDS